MMCSASTGRACTQIVGQLGWVGRFVGWVRGLVYTERKHTITYETQNLIQMIGKRFSLPRVPITKTRRRRKMAECWCRVGLQLRSGCVTLYVQNAANWNIELLRTCGSYTGWRLEHLWICTDNGVNVSKHHFDAIVYSTVNSVAVTFAFLIDQRKRTPRTDR